MSWSVEFINWNESNSGVALHTISENIFDINLESERITGVDYYKQESRGVTIRFLYDDSIFINTNLLTNMTSYDEDSSKSFWKYAIRILDNGAIIFTGWVKLSSLKYNKKEKTIEIKAMDILAVMVSNNNRTWFYSNEEYDFDTFLQQNINYSFAGGTGIQYGYDVYGISFTDNYDYQTGISQTGLQIIMEDYNFGVQNWADFGTTEIFPASDHFWGLTGDSAVVVRTVRHLGLNSEGDVQLTLMKYMQSYWTTGSIWTFTENIAISTCLFDNNLNAYAFHAERLYSDPYSIISGSATIPADIQTKIDAESYYNVYYLDVGYPEEDNLSYQINNDDTVYFANAIEDPTIIQWNGLMRFTTVDIKVGTYKLNDLIRMCLMINNLVLRISVHGDVEIVNKDYTINNITINNSDILEYKQSSVIRSNVDYEYVLYPMVGVNVDNIADALRGFYSEHMPQYEYNLRIINSYDLNLNDEIVVYGKSLMIAEINKDLDNFYYTIKAWSI